MLQCLCKLASMRSDVVLMRTTQSISSTFYIEIYNFRKLSINTTFNNCHCNVHNQSTNITIQPFDGLRSMGGGGSAGEIVLRTLFILLLI